MSQRARNEPDAGWRGAKDEALIDYLLRNRHTSPFEHCVLTFEVSAPIFVFRQWHRHRTWSYSEISARYSELPEECYVPPPGQVTEQSTKNHQSRTDAPLPDWKVRSIRSLVSGANRAAFKAYRMMLKLGCPRELARTVLPLGTHSRMAATVNLLNFLRFLALRADEHAQYEIRVYAKAMTELARAYYPRTLEAWDRHGL